MKLDESLITEDFMVKTGIIAGEECRLITPGYIGAKWTKENLHLRSSVWNSRGELISAGFEKFVNSNEAPDLYPQPKTGQKGKAIEKMDGSTLIVSKYNGEVIIRTRGSFNTEEMLNAFEIPQLIKDNKKFFDDIYSDEIKTIDYSYIFEWTSPNGKIVVNYPEAKLTLIGIIGHFGYKKLPQNHLDVFAASYGLNRPRSWDFNCPSEIISHIENLQKFGIEDKIFEGWCLYYGEDDKYIRKYKTELYLKCHKFRENCNTETVLDMYIESGRPDYNTMYKMVCDNFDWECAEMARGEISQCCDANKEVEKIVSAMVSTVEKVSPYPSRKDMALEITQKYGTTNRASFVFNLLDKKLKGEEIGAQSFTKEQMTKLFWQTLKK